MRKHFLLSTLILCVWGCSQKPIDPAAGAPNFPLNVERFDSAFFEMDTLHTTASLSKLQSRFPNFTTDFITKVLMINTLQDTQLIKTYLRTYMPIYKEAKKLNAIKIAQPFLEDGFKHFHYYFPNYNLPHKLILFVGPLGLYGNIITKDAVAVGLQMYLGASSSWYQTESLQTIYPTYKSSRLEPSNMVVIAIENLIEDLPRIKESDNLMNNMIEAGKKQYLLKACLPNFQDSILFGYTNEQLKILNKEESKIWDYIVADKLIYTTNTSDIMAIMQESTSNEIFGEDFPGNIGKYIGFKIVDIWMHQKAQTNITMEQLLLTPAQQIFSSANYNP